MRENCLYGSVRGDRGDPVPYRDNAMQWDWVAARACGQLSQMTLATRWTAARKLRAVFS
jgi:hypothetical protein